jgi:hypothetical protein
MVNVGQSWDTSAETPHQAGQVVSTTQFLTCPDGRAFPNRSVPNAAAELGISREGLRRQLERYGLVNR